ncbi:O-antigen ligase family protein [Alteraurantiacibacter aestuarii]|uniref:O-antigen ligase family protein n=1 Tax=Alteraurantiacibacter aestuarii TaxID=650004 RepID=UPI0031DB645F
MALAIMALNRQAVSQFFREAPRALVGIVLLSLALPLLQIVPLPAAIWQALPGRELVSQTYDIAGIDGDSWFTWSVDPVRTLVAFCSTIAPAAIIVIGWSLSSPMRLRLALTLIVASLLALLLGAYQLSTANTSGILQAISPDTNVLYATFSNRNSTGIFFVIAAIIVAALPSAGRSGLLLAQIAAGSLMVIATILTQSRSSMALLLVFLAFLTLRLGAHFWAARAPARKDAQTPKGAAQASRKAVYLAAILGLAMVCAIAASLAFGGRASSSVERFANLDTDRTEVWEDGIYVAQRYWPVGSGTGTFDEVFQIDESLEYVSLARAGRAHNDYVEIAIESGLLGPLLVLAWFVWIGMAATRRTGDSDRWLAFGAAASLACIALQSGIDYPLRNEAMLCVAAIMIVLLFPPRRAVR